MKHWKVPLFCLICLTGLYRQPIRGAEYLFSQGVGGIFGNHTIVSDDSLVELARHYDLGYNEITTANPGVDPFIPTVGSAVAIPRIWILPDAPVQRGIIINLSEMRLYAFHPKTRGLVETFPVGIGDEGWVTPTGTYRVSEKMVNPAWHVPASIRRERPELPKVVAPGGGNPLGSHALRLSGGRILIHGTNRPFGIGRQVSHGCIHLYPEDIVTLFRTVPLGTPVSIVRQQVKATEVSGWVVVEIHGDGGRDLEREALQLLKRKGLLAKADLGRLRAAIRVASGMPTDITRKE